ncbi:MAG: permease-like cell division protein FtsX [Holophagales bacterium]|jgi:cell division transport system permease protein|nr:permease-like cell division protein FtsX [Holophagales bacterium]
MFLFRPFRLVWLVFKDVNRDFLRHRSHFLLAILSLATGLFIVGGGLLGIDTLDKWVGQMQSLARITVFAAEGASVKTLEENLKLDPRFTSVRLVTSEEATKQFAESVADAGLLLGALGRDAVPDNLELTLREDLLERRKAIEVGQGLRSVLGVGDVVVDHERLDSLLKGARMVRSVLAIFGFILLAVAAFSTGTVVRMSIMARDEEINIMRLVGATELFILTPLLAEGAVLGLFAALAAAVALWTIWLLLALGMLSLSPFVAEILKLAIFSFKNLALLSMTGILTGAIGALWGFRSSAQSRKIAEKLMNAYD